MRNHCCIRERIIVVALLVAVFILGMRNLASAQTTPANFVVLSYDISGSMRYQYIPREIHDRIKSYLKTILFAGWGSRSPEVGDVFTVQPAREFFSRPLLTKGSGCSIIHFGETMRVKVEVGDVSGSAISSNNLFFPTEFQDRNTVMKPLLEKVGAYASREVNSGRPCFWIFISDNIEDISGVGGGDSNEAFQQLSSRFYYKPVFGLKIPAGRMNYQGKPASAFITIARVLDVKRQALNFGPKISELEAQLNELGKDETVARHTLYRELSGSLDTLKNDVRAVNNSVERLNAVQEKIANITIGIEALKEIRGFWKELVESKKQLDIIEAEDANKLVSKQVEPIRKKIKSLETVFPDTDKAQISQKLYEIKIDIAKLSGQSQLGIQLDYKTLEELERRHQSLERKNPGAPHAGQLAEIGNELKELRQGFEKLSAGDRKSRMETIAKKLDAIEASIDQDSQYKPYFERLAAIKRNIQSLEQNAVPAWATALKTLRDKADEYEKNLTTFPVATIPKMLEDLEAAVDRERQFGPHFQRLAEIKKNIQALEPNVAPAWAVALKSLRDKADEYENTLHNYPLADIPPLLDALEAGLANIPKDNRGTVAAGVLLGVVVLGLICWWLIKVLTRKTPPIKIRLAQIVDGVEKDPKEYLLTSKAGEGSIDFTGDPNDPRAYPLEAPKYRVVKVRSGIALRCKGKVTPLDFGQNFTIQDELEENTYTMIATNIEIIQNSEQPGGGDGSGTDSSGYPQ